MLIERVLPVFVSAKSTLRKRLFAEAEARGLSNAYADAIESLVPERLINAGAFLDRLTGLWRYEFGVPYNIGERLVIGTNMFVPVESLFSALSCAYLRLPENKRAIYFERLANLDSHQATLAEMIPGYKVDLAVPLEFEVAGMGAGNRTVDWVIGPWSGRNVCLDVKRRIFDLIKHAEGIGAKGAVKEPDHDPNGLFRSVEQKFVEADPDSRLQGAWIVTNIKQDEEQLNLAFAALDPNKVHFAILGDWKPDIYVLARRETDRQYLLKLFRAEPSTRFTSKRSNEG